MTRSIFDPSGGETEHSGSRFSGPTADNNSHMPTSITDGKVSEEEAAEQEAAPAADTDLLAITPAPSSPSPTLSPPADETESA